MPILREKNYNARMFNRKFQRLVSYMALIAMCLATLVPSLSMAFPAQTSKGFVQEICSRSGTKLYLTVATTKGNQVSTALDFNPAQKPASVPSTLDHHLNHCPFCHMSMDDVVMPASNPAYVLYQLALAKQQQTVYIQPVVTEVFQTAHPSRAPPSTLLI